MPFTDFFFINPTINGDQGRNQEVISLNNGNFAAIYSNSEIQGEIALQIFDISGNKIGSEKVVNNHSSGWIEAAGLTSSGEISCYNLY